MPTRVEGNTIRLPSVEIGGGAEGGIESSVPEPEDADDAGSMSVALAQSIDTVCRSPVQGTIVEKRRRIMTGSVDRANRVKCEINLIGGALSEMDPLARMMVSNGRMT